MKKIFLAIATLALISSCSKQEITNAGVDSSAIGFNSYVNRITRAADADLETLKDGFSVYGYYREGAAGVFVPNFFWGSQVSYSPLSSMWTYSDTKYWPTDGYIDFVAVANNTGSFYADTTNGATVLYDGAADPAEQKDLLVATAYNTSKANNALNGVDLQFKHVLSRIDVKVKNTTGDPTLKLVVKSIKFKNILTYGEYKVSDKSWKTYPNDGVTCALGLASTQIEQVGGASNYVSANAAAGALIIVPQAQTTMEVEYEYYQESADGQSYIRVANFTGPNKKTVTLTGNWNTDTKYTYELGINNDMTPITFTASVSNWTNSVTVSSDL